MANQKASAAILGVTVTAVAVVGLIAAAIAANQMFSIDGLTLSKTDKTPTTTGQASTGTGQTSSQTGAVESIGVNIFWDAGCTNATTRIDWGEISPGESKNVTIYLENPGSAPETLSMTTGNWSSSSAQSKIEVQWDQEGYLLAQGKPLRAILTLSVDKTIAEVDRFTFDMAITGTAL